MIGFQEVEQICADEGFESKPYQDHLGVWTIGHGLTFLTEDESKFIVEHFRVPAMERELQRALPWVQHCHPEVQRVLINMAYNIGVPRLLGFEKALTAAKEQDYRKMAAEMRDSRWYRQVTNRAERLCRRIESLDEQDEGI